jgi:plastocyanin/uncharacterized membrane protein
MTNYSRRQFLGVLGAGAVASTGFSQLASAQETPVVKMGNNYFDPIGLHIEPGATVRFNIEAGAHSATAYSDRIPDDATAFDSGTISQGSYEHTFETPGTYDYYCIPHKSVGMVGRIVVGSPGGPAEDRSIPDGEVPESEMIVEQGTISVEAFAGDGGNTGGGMMGSGMGPGMMNGRNSGWFDGLPFVGGALGMLGVVGGIAYWALHRGAPPSENDDSALVTLQRRYARGDIDEDEFQQRRERLVNSDDD